MSTMTTNTIIKPIEYVYEWTYWLDGRQLTASIMAENSISARQSAIRMHEMGIMLSQSILKI